MTVTELRKLLRGIPGKTPVKFVVMQPSPASDHVYPATSGGINGIPDNCWFELTCHARRRETMRSGNRHVSPTFNGQGIGDAHGWPPY